MINVQPHASCLVYIAASFKHLHGVRLLARELERLGCVILDWTAKASPPAGLTPYERRIWMDTDQAGGQVFEFCRDACTQADLVIYYGASGQDAGVEIGMAYASGIPILGIRGPLEGPGLMLHGAVTVWTDSGEEAIELIEKLLRHMGTGWDCLSEETNSLVLSLAAHMQKHLTKN